MIFKKETISIISQDKQVAILKVINKLKEAGKENVTIIDVKQIKIDGKNAYSICVTYNEKSIIEIYEEKFIENFSKTIDLTRELRGILSIEKQGELINSIRNRFNNINKLKLNKMLSIASAIKLIDETTDKLENLVNEMENIDSLPKNEYYQAKVNLFINKMNEKLDEQKYKELCEETCIEIEKLRMNMLNKANNRSLSDYLLNTYTDIKITEEEFQLGNVTIIEAIAYMQETLDNLKRLNSDKVNTYKKLA